MVIPHTQPSEIEWNDPAPVDSSDLRLPHLITPFDGQIADIGILGVPHDAAIVAGGGRAGASEGPDAFRRALKRFGTTYFIETNTDISSLKIVDCGNVEPTDDTYTMHQRVTEAVMKMLDARLFPIIIGGGHDLSFATIRALAKQTKRLVGGLNIDAHFDVRPVSDGVITSGTPFRRALDELNGSFMMSRFVELGMHGNMNARVHRNFVLEHGGDVITLTDFRRRSMDELIESIGSKIGDTAFLDIDVDVVQQAYAPGCSAPSPIGMYPEEITSLAFNFAKLPTIKLFNLMEISPPHDHDERTARLGVAIFSSFLHGYYIVHKAHGSSAISRQENEKTHV